MIENGIFSKGIHFWSQPYLVLKAAPDNMVFDSGKKVWIRQGQLFFSRHLEMASLKLKNTHEKGQCLHLKLIKYYCCWNNWKQETFFTLEKFLFVLFCFLAADSGWDSQFQDRDGKSINPSFLFIFEFYSIEPKIIKSTYVKSVFEIEKG